MNTDIFWNWSNAVYANPQVSQTCLLLQDQFGLNVNALLWVCWLAAQHKKPTEQALEATRALFENSNAHRVRGFRKARRSLCGVSEYIPSQSVNILKASLLEMELSLEHITQNELSALPADAAQNALNPESLSRRNLDTLLAAHDKDIIACRPLLDTLCGALFTNADLEPAATQIRFAP